MAIDTLLAADYTLLELLHSLSAEEITEEEKLELNRLKWKHPSWQEGSLLPIAPPLPSTTTPAPPPLVPLARAAVQFTESEISLIAMSQNTTYLEKRWIIQRGNSFYIIGPDGVYLAPIIRGELAVSLPRDLARVPVEYFQWTYVADDKPVKKPVEMLLTDYATVSRRVVADMMRQYSYYDPATMMFYEAACPLKRIEPAYDEQIHRWLCLLGGENAGKLIDWIATVTRLDRVTCALYIDGPKDAGKTMLAQGLAQLWGYAATELKSLTGNFNSALMNCPLVFADEEIPKQMTSGFLRALVGSSSRTLTRKFMPEAELLGGVRLIIAANDPDLLKFDEEDFSEDSVAAVAARILYIKTSKYPGNYLKSIGGRTATQGWVENGAKIAAHALWLRDNHVVQPGSRFLVEGKIDTIHRRLITHGSVRGLIIEWIGKFLMKPKGDTHPGILVGGGKLYVNTSYVQETWAFTMDDKRVPPSLKRIGGALKPMSQGQRVMKCGSTGRREFYDLKLPPILEALEELQLGTTAKFKELVEAPRAYLDAISDEPDPDAVLAPENGSAKRETDSLWDRL